MKKVALVFVLAVIVPSLVLAWLAVRSLRDQQFVLERQRVQLYQGVADALAQDIQNYLAARQREFTLAVDTLLARGNPREAARAFDGHVQSNLPIAQVGFAVTLGGEILAPSPLGRREAREFFAENSQFLGNRDSAEMFWNTRAVNFLPKTAITGEVSGTIVVVQTESTRNAAGAGGRFPPVRGLLPLPSAALPSGSAEAGSSRLASVETEFRQLIGDAQEGILARFLDNKLNVLFWYRPPRDPRTVFGIQLSVPQLTKGMKAFLNQFEPSFREEICIAVLDDTARPVALSQTGFLTNWKRPFAATELGEALPHWEAAVYLSDPGQLARSARTIRLTLGLLIAVLLLAIAMGSWLIVADLERNLKLARQKTDFVSNVSHELKTPLTSIRMFAELLAEERVDSREKQRSYLQIISSEAARLTRLINNVLDFSRMERGEKKYNLAPCDLGALLSETAAIYRPHLESGGFKFECDLPTMPVPVNVDRDALAQVLVNLLSNAEKYSDGHKDIRVELTAHATPLPHAEIRVLDRGMGVPEGCGERIFEQFFRAHDGLGCGIQGSGLGLTLARQIARTHGGDVVYSPRDGGGSCFSLRLPALRPPRSEFAAL